MMKWLSDYILWRSWRQIWYENRGVKSQLSFKEFRETLYDR